MAILETRKKYSDLTRDEFIELSKYLTKMLWDSENSECVCPLCGGIITCKDGVTKCSNVDCIYIELRGV